MKKTVQFLLRPGDWLWARLPGEVARSGRVVSDGRQRWGREDLGAATSSPAVRGSS